MSDYGWNNIPELDMFLEEGKTTCSTSSLSIASVLERASDLGTIEGTGIVVSASKLDYSGEEPEPVGHVWAEFVKDGERMVLDPTMDYIGEPNDHYIPSYDIIE